MLPRERLRADKRVGGIEGLKEPRGVAYVPEADRLIVSSGRAGSVDIYDGRSLEFVDEVQFGEDPDNVYYDPPPGALTTATARAMGRCWGWSTSRRVPRSRTSN